MKTAGYYASLWGKLFQREARMEGWDLFYQDDGTFKIQAIDDSEAMAAELGVPSLHRSWANDDELEEYVASRDDIQHQLPFYLQWRNVADVLLIPDYWDRILMSLLIEQGLDASDICPSHESGVHVPDWGTLSIDDDGDEVYVDVKCVNCGRSGCVGQRRTLEEGINW